MTFEEAKDTRVFWNDYYENQQERLTWNDVQLTSEQFFEVWLRKDEEACNILKKSSM